MLHRAALSVHGAALHAFTCLCFQRRGRWNGHQLLSKQRIDHSLAPCPIKPEYGFPWWLNHQHDMSDLARLEARDERPVDSDKFTYPSGGET